MSNRARILMRYGLISFLLIFFAIGIVYQLVKTTVVHAEEWNHVSDSVMNLRKVIPPERGNILADNGNILACNLTLYDVNFDMRHQKVSDLGKKLPWAEIDALADSLDRYYPLPGAGDQPIDKNSDYSWHKRFQKEFGKDRNKRPRALKIVKKGTLDDFERIKTFPFFKDFTGKGTRNPVYVDPKSQRIYPFGKMAHRSIGRVSEMDSLLYYKNYGRKSVMPSEFHGYSGLERDLDSLLYGKVGYAKKVIMTNGVDHMVEQTPVKGNDVQTTINIDLQDMVEEELTTICQNVGAKWGMAILMEVETGEIKAIANVELLEDGTYGESLNRAVRGFEPGSVMKPISLMVAFEDGLVKNVTDMVDCSPFQKTSDPHAPTVKSVKQVIEMSSNTGISRILFRGYSKDPEAYHERLRSIGFFDPMHSGIAGEQTPYFPPVGDKDIYGNRQTMTARHLTLARQCYGYSATIPPLYTLAYYNAIANGGVLIKPHLVKKLLREEGDSVINLADLSTRVCSEETARKMRECLLEPVWGTHGTARTVRDDRVKIAGKTGTAFPIPENGGTYDTSKRRFAFAGFFPADSPKYSCMALVLAPAGSTSAGRSSGEVVKNVALKLYSRGMLDNVSTFTASKNGGNPSVSRSGTADNFAKGSVPDLKGYDLESAVRILEKLGYSVGINGAGYVVGQLPEAGTPLRPGSKVKLTLRI